MRLEMNLTMSYMALISYTYIPMTNTTAFSWISCFDVSPPSQPSDLSCCHFVLKHHHIFTPCGFSFVSSLRTPACNCFAPRGLLFASRGFCLIRFHAASVPLSCNTPHAARIFCLFIMYVAPHRPYRIRLKKVWRFRPSFLSLRHPRGLPDVFSAVPIPRSVGCWFFISYSWNIQIWVFVWACRIPDGIKESEPLAP
jgi:hypothetical protein